MCFHLALGVIGARAAAIASMGYLSKDCMNLCPCLRPQEEDKEVVFFQREMSANQLMELSVEV